MNSFVVPDTIQYHTYTDGRVRNVQRFYCVRLDVGGRSPHRVDVMDERTTAVVVAGGTQDADTQPCTAGGDWGDGVWS